MTGVRSRPCNGFADTDGPNVRAPLGAHGIRRRGRRLSPIMNPQSTVHTFLVASLVALASTALPAGAEEPLLVYGPGGPAPAMKEAAAAFSKAEGVRVEVTAGPTDTSMRRPAPTPTSSTAGTST